MRKKILVFSFSFIGDAVLSMAVIQPLRTHFPDAHITFLVGPRALDLFANEPQLDIPLVYDNRGEHAGWKGRVKLIKTLHRKATPEMTTRAQVLGEQMETEDGLTTAVDLVESFKPERQVTVHT